MAVTIERALRLLKARLQAERSQRDFYRKENTGPQRSTRSAANHLMYCDRASVLQDAVEELEREIAKDAAAQEDITQQ